MDFGPPSDDDDKTAVATPNWLGGVHDGMPGPGEEEAVQTPWGAPRPIEVARERPPPQRPQPAPRPPQQQPPTPSSLRPEELFGGETTPQPQLPEQRPPSAEAPREAKPRKSEGAPSPTRPVVWMPKKVPPVDKGKRAVVRVSLVVLGLVLVLFVFVWWRNGFRFGSPGKMITRAFAPRAAQVRSQVPGIEIRGLQRSVYENRLGQRALTVTGVLTNTSSQQMRAVSVLIRFFDRTGAPVAEREHLATGLFEPEVLANLADATQLVEEYRKRRTRSVIPPGGKLEFTVVFFPLPRALEGRKFRMLVEVTSAVVVRG